MRTLVFAAAMLFTVLAQAAPQIPDALQDWRNWVLQDQEYRACPLVAGSNAATESDFVCAWPGVLRISADADGADVSQHWQRQVAGWVPLPGDRKHWPQNVRVNGRAAPVVDHFGPQLWLEPGTHQVQARLDWDERPQALSVPASVALIALEVDGAAVIPVQRNGSQLTLGRSAAASVEADSLDLRVFRLFTDNVPGILTTRLRIQVAGQAREVLLGPVLPDGFTPMTLDSENWSARLEDDGRLRVQVQPGDDVITLKARATAPVSQLVARLPDGWAAQEIWSYQPMPTLRITHVTGALQIDPRQADVPADWQPFAAFVLNDADVLEIEQRSRGLAAGSGNRLSLEREAWLNFSGDGWFAKDAIRGRMATGWRFDLARPWQLQRAQDGNAADPRNALLITRGADAAWSGVEWRAPQVNLLAGIRSDDSGSRLPVSGWQQVFDEVSMTVHLPYGYRLIAAPGTDRGNGSWLSRWTLLDLFLVAVLVLLSGHLLGRTGGALVALYLVLGFHEPAAPLWTLFAAIVLSAALRALPAGRLQRMVGGLRGAALLVLVVVALPFAVQQFRQALYPQLEPGDGWTVSGFFDSSRSASSLAPHSDEEAIAVTHIEPPPQPAPAPTVEGGRMMAPSSSAPAPRLKSSVSISQYSQSTVVQTGAGEPGWRLGSQYRLHWSGPVLSDQQVRLWIAPPWLVRPLRLLLIGALGLLLWRLVGAAVGRWRGGAIASGGTGLLLAVALGLPSSPVVAQDFPPDALLDALQQRLTRAPDCVPQCANLAQAQVSASGDQITVALEFHALHQVAVPLPGDGQGLNLQHLNVDGVAIGGVARRDAVSWIALDRGVHRVELRFDAISDQVALAFPMRPDRLGFRGDGWQSNGLAEHRLLTETLAIHRERRGTADAGPDDAAATQQFPPYVRLLRQVNLDLDWSVVSQAQRMAPAAGGFTLELPMLEGEHVSTPGITVKGGSLTLAMADGQPQARWNSTLDTRDSMTLTAPDLAHHAEVWTFLVSPTWHVEFDGVPESAPPPTESTAEYHQFRFDPLPGERLTLRISKPVAEAGATRAIDRLSLRSKIGARSRSHTLQIALRASQGGEHRIRLPDQAELLEVRRDGQAIGARLVDGQLSLPLRPGEQNFDVRFRETGGAGLSTTTPSVALGLPAANIHLSLQLPNDRWLLAAFGPTVGPAVLFWSELLAMIVLAWLLARSGRSELRFHHWLLLGLGFSTFSWIALLVVVAWLFAIEWRARRTIQKNWRFNLVQMGLLGLTFAALLSLANSIRQGLLGQPDMVIRGNGSYGNTLDWFADRSSDLLPQASVVSLPLWVFNVLMLLWALWLAWSVVGWLRRGMQAWMHNGYWRPWRAPKPAPSPEPADPSTQTHAEPE